MTIKTKLSIAAALLAMSGVASAADTCGSPTVLDGSAAFSNLAGDTCTGSAQAVSLCGAFDYSQKKEIIYSFQLSADQDCNIADRSPTCRQGYYACHVRDEQCLRDCAIRVIRTARRAFDLTGLTAGTPYFLIVSYRRQRLLQPTAVRIGLNTNGTLPVRLKGFLRSVIDWFVFTRTHLV